MRPHTPRMCLAALLLTSLLAAPASAAGQRDHAGPQSPAGFPLTAGEAYIHASTSANTGGDSTYLDNPLLNNNPHAIVLAVPQTTPYGGGLATVEALGVWYNNTPKKWAVFNENLDTLFAGQAWNIYVPPPIDTQFVHTTHLTNTVGSITTFDNPQLNGHPEANLFVEHVYNPPGQPISLFTATVALIYNNVSARWTLQSQSGLPMPLNTSFFVVQAGAGEVSYRHVASASNSPYPTSTMLDNPLINGNPDAMLLAAQNGGLSNSAITSNARLDLFYSGLYQRWFITSEDGSGWPAGLTFNVLIVPPQTGFVLQTAGNIANYDSLIDDPALNGNPYARLYVQHNRNPPEAPLAHDDNHPVGVFYNTGSQHWYVYNRDFAAITPGTTFNVFYTQPRGNSFFISADTYTTATARSLKLIGPVLNGHSHTVGLVSYNKSPDGVSQADYTAPVGLRFLSNFWQVFNTAGPNFPLGLTYNVYVPPTASTRVVTATSGLGGNLSGGVIFLDDPLTNDDAYARLFVTERDNGGLNNAKTVGVLYNGSQWALYNEDFTAIPAGTVFHVFVYKGRTIFLPLVQR